MARPLTRAQREQNRAFLTVLRRSGNVRLACREVGAKYGTMQHRRRHHEAFAQRWDAALAFAQAGLAQKLEGGRHGSESRDVDRVRFAPRRPASAVSRHNDARSAPLTLCSAARTVGGEPHLVRLKNGRVQLRVAQPGKLTRQCEQAFLAALSATANVTLSAAAAGASPRAFYRRKRQCPAFAREMRLALQRSYDGLELALMESTLPDAHEHDAWRSNAPPAIPPMTVNQALQLMYLHQKEARLTEEPYWLKRRRYEPWAAHIERLVQMAEERDRQRLEEFEVAEAERWAQGLPAWGLAGEDVRRKLGLPDLAQVTGWSRADPDKEARDPDTALFGGWRIEDMEQRDAESWGTLFEEDESQREETSSCGRRGARPQSSEPDRRHAGFTPRDGPRVRRV
jgi:hypothetical protein